MKRIVLRVFAAAGTALLCWTWLHVDPRTYLPQPSAAGADAAVHVPVATGGDPGPVNSRIAFREVPQRPFDGFLGVFLDPTAGARRLPPDLHLVLPSISDPGEIHAVEDLLLDERSDDAVRNEAANLLRRSRDAHLDQLLLTILDRPSEPERFRSFAVQHLGISLESIPDAGDPRIRHRLHDALGDHHASVRREALLALSRAHDPMIRELLPHGLAEPQWRSSRDVFIHIAHQDDDRSCLPAIRALLADDDESTQIAAIYVLGQWADQESRGPIHDLVSSTHRRLREAATMADERIQGRSPSDRPAPATLTHAP